MNRLFFPLFVALALVSCGKEPDPEPAPGPGPEVTGFNIDGVAPGDFVIVYNPDEEDNASYLAALELRNAFKLKGVNINVTKKSSAGKEHEIVVGNCGRECNKAFYEAPVTDIFDWQISCADGKLALSGCNSWALKAAANELISGYISADKAAQTVSGNCRKGRVFEMGAGCNLRIFDWNIWSYDSTTIPAAFYANGVLLYDPRNANRAKDFAAVIKGISPDVFGLQEYTSKMNGELTKYISSQYAQVTTSSSQWNWTPLFYDKTTVVLKKAEYYLFPAPWSNSNSKSYTIALFNHKPSGKDFIVVCTHMWWKSESAQAGSDQARLDQAGMIISQVAQWLHSYDVPVFVMGDMNCNLSSSAMKAFVSDGYKSSAQDAEGSKDGSRGYHSCSENGFSPETADQADRSKNGTTAIDHIWFKNCGTTAIVRDYWIVHSSFTFPMSDHAPRFVDIRMN